MRTLIILTLAAFALVSCRSKDLIRPGDSLEVAFEKAKSQYDDENWTNAANAFETVVSIGRGTDLGQEAQFLLAESYYNNRQYLIAASEYQRYANYYPRSERREIVDFKSGLCYYHLSPRFKLDQTHTRQAVEEFGLFKSRYPDSERIAEVDDYIEELRSKLARKKYEAANFYFRTDRYEAAIVYHNMVIDEYPETKWAENALVDQIEAYILYADNSVESRQKERYEEAIASYERYMELFPRGENRSKAEDLYDRAMIEIDQIDERSGESVAQNE